MRSVSDDYKANEQAKEVRPAELFHLWEDSETGRHWYYTSGDEPVTFNGKEYVPAGITRENLSYDTELQATKLSVTAGHIDEAFRDYLAQQPTEQLWVSLMRVHRDDPSEVMVLFMGQCLSVSFKGATAKGEFAGFQKFLQMEIPRYRYQPHCNNTLFDGFCKIPVQDHSFLALATPDTTGKVLSFDDSQEDVEAHTAHLGEAFTVGYPSPTYVTVTGYDEGIDYTLAGNEVTVLSDGNITEGETLEVKFGYSFSSFGDGYFSLGWVEFQGQKRMIVSHVGLNITVQYPFNDMAEGAGVKLYAGCDQRIETCRDKFDNVNNFFGTPYIPQENPSERMS